MTRGPCGYYGFCCTCPPYQPDSGIVLCKDRCFFPIPRAKGTSLCSTGTGRSIVFISGLCAISKRQSLEPRRGRSLPGRKSARGRRRKFCRNDCWPKSLHPLLWDAKGRQSWLAETESGVVGRAVKLQG